MFIDWDLPNLRRPPLGGPCMPSRTHTWITNMALLTDGELLL
jgi:hypothetical protein